MVVDRIGRSGLQLLGVLIAALTGTAALLAPLWALPYVPASVLAWVWFHRVRQRARRLAAVQDTERSRLRERPAAVPGPVPGCPGSGSSTRPAPWPPSRR